MYKKSWKLLVCHIAELVSIPNYTTLHTQKAYITFTGFLWHLGHGQNEVYFKKKKMILSTEYYLNH